MELDDFLDNDLEYIKENLKLNIVEQSADNGSTILNRLIIKNKDLEIIKCIFEFVNTSIPNLFLEKFNGRHTILHITLYKRNNYSEETRFIFDFVKKNFPNLFLEKLHPALVICIKTSKDPNTVKYIFDFTKNNFPEILSDKIIKNYSSKNNLVLPLTFQIHN